jgi:hypothetical protein
VLDMLHTLKQWKSKLDRNGGNSQPSAQPVLFSPLSHIYSDSLRYSRNRVAQESSRRKRNQKVDMLAANRVYIGLGIASLGGQTNHDACSPRQSQGASAAYRDMPESTSASMRSRLSDS